MTIEVINQDVESGDQSVCLVCTGYHTDQSHVDKVVTLFEEKGYSVRVSGNLTQKKVKAQADNMFGNSNYLQKFAGTPQERYTELQSAICGPERVIYAMRGGYGTCEVAEMLTSKDFEIIENKNKVFVGSSDFVSLLSRIFSNCPSALAFHAPLGIQSVKVDDTSFEKLIAQLSSINRFHSITADKDAVIISNPKFKHGQGRVIGGNLVTISSLVGTDLQYNFNDKIALFEEISETPRHIDRALKQLIASRTLDGVKGVILASFKGCGDKHDLIYVFKKHFKGLNCPVVFGFSIGHIYHQETVPLNCLSALDINDQMPPVLSFPSCEI